MGRVPKLELGNEENAFALAKRHSSPDAYACRRAKAVERLRGPSPSTRLGMTPLYWRVYFPLIGSGLAWRG